MFNKIFYKLTRIVFRFLFRVYNRQNVRWEAPLPPSDRYIVVGNHCSNLDPLLVSVNFPIKLRCLAKDELFRPFFLGRVIRILGGVPVLQEDKGAAAAALKHFFKLLDDGESVILFPEGTRSPDGMLKPLEGGAALIALHSGVPVIPAYASGTFDAMPPGAKFVKPKKLTVTFGKAIFPPKEEDGKSSKKMRAEFTEILTKALSEMESKYASPETKAKLEAAKNAS